MKCIIPRNDFACQGQREARPLVSERHGEQQFRYLCISGGHMYASAGWKAKLRLTKSRPSHSSRRDITQSIVRDGLSASRKLAAAPISLGEKSPSHQLCIAGKFGEQARPIVGETTRLGRRCDHRVVLSYGKGTIDRRAVGALEDLEGLKPD